MARLVRVALLGLIEQEWCDTIKDIPSIKRLFERRSEIHIVITSGSLWQDEQGTLREYIRTAVEQAARVGLTDSSDAFDVFESAGVVGDVLWQP